MSDGNNSILRKSLDSIRGVVFGSNRNDNITKSLDDIKTDVFGGINTFALDKKVDNVLSKMSGEILNKNAYNYAELIRDAITEKIDSKFFENNINTQILSSPDLSTRVNRYTNFSEVCDCIPACARAVKVLTDAVLSPDDITKKSIQIFPQNLFSDDDEKAIDDVKAVVEQIDLDDEINDIVHDTIKYGDQFAEICHYNSKEVPITQSMMLSESFSVQEKDDIIRLSENEVRLEYTVYDKDNNLLEQDVYSPKIVIVEESINKKNLLTEDSNEEERPDIKDVKIIIHNPSRIIKIQSSKFRMNLGYLVLPDSASGYSTYGFSSSGYTTPNSQSTMGGGGTAFGTSSLTNNVSISGIDDLYAQIITMIKKYIDKSDDVKFDKEGLREILQKTISDLKKTRDNQYKIRYVPPDRMEHFYMNNKKFYPYGESVLQRCLFQAKLFIALESALTIKRISESSEKRLITIEYNMPRSLRNTIENIKEALKKKKVSLDTMGTVGSIPSSITAYEDFYLPQKNGQRFVNFETIPPSSNIRDISEELKFFRDQVIGALEVPPAYLNVEENTSNRSLLSHESAFFAETILGYQKLFSKHLKSLVSKVYKYIYDKNIPIGIEITFKPPKTLQLEKEAESLEIQTRIINGYAGEGVNRKWLQQKYLDVDWKEIEQFEAKDRLEKEQTPPPMPPGQTIDFGSNGGFDLGSVQ